jgi:hypothetical protein
MTQVATVWAVETFANGHWSVVEGGLVRSVAEAEARKLASKGERVSIAEYSPDEGSSALGREEIRT